MKKRVAAKKIASEKKSKKEPQAGPEIHPAEIVEIASLKAHPRNYRKHPEPQLLEIVESIRQHGIYKNIVIAKDGTILAGHGLVLGAQKLGMKQLPVVRIPFAPDHPRALKIVAGDNGIQGMSEDDPEMLAALLQSIRDEDETGLLGSGYNEVSLKELLVGDAEPPKLGEQDRAEREDEIPAPPKNPIAKLGDVWILGDHRLICGDCRVLATVSQLLDGAKVNVGFTSPPYASQRKYDEGSSFKPIPPDSFVEWFAAVQANIASTLAADGSWFVNIKEHCDDGQRHLYVKDLTIAHVRQWGWALVDEFCWRNTKNGVPGGWNNRFKNAWEPVFHFARGGIKFCPNNVLTKSDDIPIYSPDNGTSQTGSGLLGSREHTEGWARPSNVVECAASSDRLHSAAFPVALPEFFMKAFAEQGDIVLDPFMGSGTTIIACEKTGRIARGVELSPAYCDVIIERWQTYTGKSARRAT